MNKKTTIPVKFTWGFALYSFVTNPVGFVRDVRKQAKIIGKERAQAQQFIDETGKFGPTITADHLVGFIETVYALLMHEKVHNYSAVVFEYGDHSEPKLAGKRVEVIVVLGDGEFPSERVGRMIRGLNNFADAYENSNPVLAENLRMLTKPLVKPEVAAR